MRAKLQFPRWGVIILAFLCASAIAFGQGPTLTSPGNGATWVDPVNNTFSWYYSTAGTSTIQVATDNTFSSIVYTSTTNPYITYALNIPLTSGTQYYWRVNVDGSAWSTTSSFTTTGIAPVTHTITVTAGANGSITPSGPVVTVNDGEDKIFTISPAPGYHIATLTIDGSPVDPVSPYTFTNVVANGHTIAATFAVNPPNFYVDDSGSNLNDGLTPATAWATIQHAINDISVTPGSIINVASGTYPENVTVSKALTLKSSSGAASTIISASLGDALLINSSNVVIDGFTITNPSGKRGIYSKNNNNITIKNNIITGIGTSDVTANSNIGIVIESSSAAVDGITIKDNTIKNVTGGNFKSASGISIGFTPGIYDITNLLIENNDIRDITSSILAFAAGGRGAYGILINHSTSSGTTSGAIIRNNRIDSLKGFWAHAIGLEGKTPNAVVTGNTLSNIIDTKSVLELTPDAVAIMVEDNPFANTLTITSNNFINVLVGIGNVSGPLTVNAENNWWGSANGPIHSGNTYNVGSQGHYVTDYVDYVPWLDDTVGTGVSFAPVTKTGPSYYSSIQAAINSAVNGNEISAASGTYNEQVVINSINLTLQGTGNSTIIKPLTPGVISAFYTYPAGVFPGWVGIVMASTVLVENGSNVTIKNLKIDGVNVTSLPAGSNRLAGILFGNSSGTIDNVTVTAIKTAGYAERTYGIDLSAVSGSHNVEVMNCSITDWARNGIQVMGANLTVNIHDNILTGPGAIGPANVPNGIVFIHGVAGNASRNTLHGMHYSDPSDEAAGILVYDPVTPGINILNNEIYDVDDAITLAHNPNFVVVSENNLHNNKIGVQLEDGANNNAITNNTIITNSIAGIRCDGPANPNLSVSRAIPDTGNYAHNNNISGNTMGAISYDVTKHFNAINNWWGSITGPFHSTNPSGTGNAVTDYIDFNPWSNAVKPKLNVGDVSGAFTYSTVSVPVKLDVNGTGGVPAGLLLGKLQYNPAKLKFLSAVTGTGTLFNSAGWYLLAWESPAGTINFSISPGSAIDSNGTLFTLNMKILENAASTATITGIAAEWSSNGAPGIFGEVNSGTLSYSPSIGPSNLRGDATLDFNVDYNDLLAVLYHLYVPGNTLTGQALTNADADLSGVVDINDMLEIMHYIAFGSWSSEVSSSSSNALLDFNGFGYENNGLIEIPVNVKNLDGVQTGEVLLNYNPEELSYQSFQSALNSGFVFANQTAEGKAQFTFVNPKAIKGNFSAGKIIMRFKDGQTRNGAKITAQYKLNNGELKDGGTLVSGVTGLSVMETNIVPDKFILEQNYPNPFNPSTMIKFGIPQASFVSVKIYDMLGQLVKTLVNEERNAGTYRLTWNGDSDAGIKVTSGAYIYRVIAGNNIRTMKMLLIK